MSSWRIYKPQHAILLRILNQAASIKSSTWFEISSCQRWTRPSPIQTAFYVWLILSQLQRTTTQLGPESVKTLTETCVYYSVPRTPGKSCFFKLTIHHNFIFMWNIANKKKFHAAGNSDAGGDNSVYETIVCKKAHLRIDVCLTISSIKSKKKRGAKSVPCDTRFFK